MKIKQTILVLALLITGSAGLLFAPAASAATCGGEKLEDGQSCCNGVITSLITCDDRGKEKESQGSCNDKTKPTNGTCKYEGLCWDKKDNEDKNYTSPGDNGKCKDPKVLVKYIAPNDITKSGIWTVLVMAINILTVGVGIAAVAGILWGSFLFITAAGSPEQFKKARMVIFETVLGIVVYAVMYAFINYLIPGGLFS